jgi:hypothetical protein
MEDLKEVKDKLVILLGKEIVIDSLPKELSEIRIKLKEI